MGSIAFSSGLNWIQITFGSFNASDPTTDGAEVVETSNFCVYQAQARVQVL